MLIKWPLHKYNKSYVNSYKIDLIWYICTKGVILCVQNSARTIMMKIKLKLYYMFMQVVFCLPIKVYYSFSNIIYFFLAKVLHYRKNEVLCNLSRSFPEKKYWEINQLADTFYRHLSWVFAETFWFASSRNKPQKLHDSRLCELTNVELLNHAYESSPSVLILMSHFGNWELIGGMYQYLYGDAKIEKLDPHDVCVVYLKLRSPFWEEVMKRGRLAQCPDTEGYIESSNVLRYALSHKDQKKVYVFPTDQYPYGRAKYVELDSFLNQKTKTMLGAAQLANKLSYSVLYMSIDRQEKGHYKMSFTQICEDASKLSPEEIMRQYYALLEQDIINNPTNYLWSHKRWK